MAYLVLAVLAIVLAVTLQSQPPTQQPPSISELEVPTAEQGRPIPKVFGRRVVKSPNIVFYGNISYKDVKAEGGK